ncbi:MAG: dipeptidase [Defluviitaleaceae bacterium]|nr:dipeptidase [Defluviitaleaceae bacterium]
MYFVDGHCDSLTLALSKGEDLYDHSGHLSIEKLARFAPSVQVFAIWLSDEQVAAAYESTVEIMNHARGVFDANSAYIRLATSYDDIARNIDERVCSAILGLEGGEPIGGDMGRLHDLHARGLRVLTLTWNRDNELSGSIAAPDAGGLTAFGREVVAECGRLGALVDVSHISKRGFWDVAETAVRPFFASHSNCKAIASHKRNIDDEQIRAIASRGGVVGVNFCDAFLSDSPSPDMDDVLRHIGHIINIGGVECTALGGDLDGISPPESGWFEDVTVFKSLYERVAKLHGSSSADKIFFGNYLRMFKEAMK